MTALAVPVRARATVSRRAVAAGTFILLGLIDIFLFGLFAHTGDATFAFTVSGTSAVPSIHAPAALTAYVLGAWCRSRVPARSLTWPDGKAA
jgi:hypothetical protein